jgi:flagellar basal body P-ring formation protein FlgA
MRLALLLACCAALPASAATLRPYTTLASGTVLLSDLFDGAEARSIGPGPAPGGRIVVEAPQLTAIARMFGVDWRPSSPGDRALLERPGRSLTKEDAMPALRAALLEAGAPSDSEIDLPGFTTPMVPAGAPPALDISATSFDAATGRFGALLTATLEGAPPIQVRLAGRVQEMVTLPVPRRPLLPGDVIGPADLQWQRMRITLARGELVRTAAQAEGQAVRRAVQPNQPIQLADLGRPLVVGKGAPLILSLDGPGIQMTAQGVAAEPGGVGDVIRVTNPYSRAVIEAEVTGPGRARVVPRPSGATQVAVR